MTSLPLLCKEFLVVDLDAKMDEGEHGEVHQNALYQERSLKMIAKPEYDPQRICHQKGQADKH